MPPPCILRKSPCICPKCRERDRFDGGCIHHHAFRHLRRIPVCVCKGPELAGFLYDRLVSETADPWFGGRIGAFFSGQEIPFPGNGDRSRQRLSSNRELLRRKHKHAPYLCDTCEVITLIYI